MSSDSGVLEASAITEIMIADLSGWKASTVGRLRQPSEIGSWAHEIPSKLEAMRWPWHARRKGPPPESCGAATETESAIARGPSEASSAAAPHLPPAPLPAPPPAAANKVGAGGTTQTELYGALALDESFPSGDAPRRAFRFGLWLAAGGLALGIAFALLI